MLPKILPPLTAEQRAAKETAALQSLLDTAASSGGLTKYFAGVTGNNAHKYLSRFITQDETCIQLKHTVYKLAGTDDPVLITGPSGVGKELIAQALHGMRPAGKFFAINCAAMPETLAESELFGHKSGAFTGAKYDNPGILRAADNGTVFLDELAEAPLYLQAKLLRSLQPAADGRRYVRPVGDTEQYPINCRIVAATKSNVRELVAANRFREDLFARLMTFELSIPGLAQRTMDIPLILADLGYTVDGVLSLLDNTTFMIEVALFNVRALQAFTRRVALLGYDAAMEMYYST
jgi:transcriptional regulator with PAS, ATPase and Fis domain